MHIISIIQDLSSQDKLLEGYRELGGAWNFKMVFSAVCALRTNLIFLKSLDST